MKCSKCTVNNAEIDHMNGKLCTGCFLDMLHRRVEKDIRQNPFKKGEKVLVCGEMTSAFLKKINKVVIDAIERSQHEAKIEDLASFDKVVIPWTADDEAEAFYESITSKEPTFEENMKVIKLFRSLSDAEVIQAAKILGIEYVQKMRHPNIESIRKKYHNSMFGLAKSADEIRKALQ